MGGNNPPLERGLSSGRNLVFDKKLLGIESFLAEIVAGEATEVVLISPMSTNNVASVLALVDVLVSASLLIGDDGFSNILAELEISINEFPEEETLLALRLITLPVEPVGGPLAL